MSSITETHQSILGTWFLSEYKAVEEGTGNTAYPLGKDAQGFLIYTADGFVSAQLMRPGAPAFADNDMQYATKDELSEAMKRYLAYCGRYELHEVDNGVMLKHNMNVCSFPNWLGDWQGRMLSLEGDELTLSTAKPICIKVSSFSHC